jgi:hypothetical protein
VLTDESTWVVPLGRAEAAGLVKGVVAFAVAIPCSLGEREPCEVVALKLVQVLAVD